MTRAENLRKAQRLAPKRVLTDAEKAEVVARWLGRGTSRGDVDDDPAPDVELPRIEVGFEAQDPVAKVAWEQHHEPPWDTWGAYRAPMPPYDIVERLETITRDATYLRDKARSDHYTLSVWLERQQQQEKILRRIVMAADRGGDLTKLLEAARDVLEQTSTRRYRRPPR